MANDRFSGAELMQPISQEPSARPAECAAQASLAALAGSWGGPLGTPVGDDAGALGDGLAERAAAASVDPIEEEAYWRNAYSSEPYFRGGLNYDDYGPAYELGWSYRERFGHLFDGNESQLASEWESQRGQSSLQWSEARDAARAAWNRIERARACVATEPHFADTDAELVNADNDEVVATLNYLIETCLDGEFGFKACAEHANSVALKNVFQQCATDCTQAVAELRGYVLQLGGAPTESGTTAGALQRGWVKMRSTLTGYDEQTMLNECETAEDHALVAYRKALKEAIATDVRAMVQRQLNGVQRNHNQIKTMRDQYRARA